MTTSLPRFGIWALVHGSRGAYQDPDEPYDASWERNRALVLAAEELGFRFCFDRAAHDQPAYR